MNKTIVLRMAEYAGLLFFALYMILLILKIAAAINTLTFGLLSIFLLLLVPIIAYVAADFASGFVHFLGDNFGSESTPFFGPKFITPFRQHHVDPAEMTLHGFVRTNGNNCLVSLIVLVPVYYQFPSITSVFSFFVAIFTVFFLLAIFLTNQFHAWAHAKAVPRIIVWLQQKRIILSPQHHSVHHTSPFDTYYCITSGWLNNILEKSGFFEAIIRLVKGPKNKV